MTPQSFREDEARCNALRRILDMPTFQLAVQAVLNDFDSLHQAQVQLHSDAQPTLELRLMNQRLGAVMFSRKLEDLAVAITKTPDDPPSTFGNEAAYQQLQKLSTEGEWPNISTP